MHLLSLNFPNSPNLSLQLFNSLILQHSKLSNTLHLYKSQLSNIQLCNFPFPEISNCLTYNSAILQLSNTTTEFSDNSILMCIVLVLSFVFCNNMILAELIFCSSEEDPTKLTIAKTAIIGRACHL